MGRILCIAAIVAASALSCGPKSPVQQGSSGFGGHSNAVILVAIERAPQGGGRLVSVSEDGSRIGVITQKERAPQVVVDRSPIFSPDGKILLFASSRGRKILSDSSLWSISVEGGTPVRLTYGDHSERDPRLSKDGHWLYFCSDRTGHFELYRGQLDKGMKTLSSVEALTQGDAEVLSPSLSPDGKSIAYMAVDPQGRSRIWKVALSGEKVPQPLTDGPLDMTPSYRDNGDIAFSAKVSDRPDADLFLLSGGKIEAVLDAPDTDETGPRWSIDGRYLFAIGMYRSVHDGNPILGSIVYIDMEETPRVYRALHDPSAVESRVGLALYPDFLSPDAMRKNPIYRDALLRVILREAVANESEVLRPVNP